MTQVKIRYVNDNIVTGITTKLSFIDFVSELFKEKIYCSIPIDGSAKLAINTDQIISVEEV
jgi:hypothetical protein